MVLAPLPATMVLAPPPPMIVSLPLPTVITLGNRGQAAAVDHVRVAGDIILVDHDVAGHAGYGRRETGRDSA